MIILVLFTIFFGILALLSLISFYFTSVNISGSLILKRTCCKKVLDRVFFGFIFIYSFFYVWYINGVLMWFILGAILNPNKFLQYATAVLTFYIFVFSKIRYLKGIKKLF